MLRPGGLLRFYIGHLRERPGAEILALLGIAAGVALVFAVQVANSSIAGSVEQLVKGITGKSSIEVAARDAHGFDQRLVSAVESTPGVTVAAPLLEQRVSLRGPRGEATVSLIGANLELASLDGPITEAFSANGIRLGRGLLLPSSVAKAIGTKPEGIVTVGTGAESKRVPVGSSFGPTVIGPLADSPVAVAPLAYAQEITGRRGRLTRVLVRTEPNATDRVRAELDRKLGHILNVRPSDSEARLIRQAAAPNDQSTTLFAAISAIVGFLFAVNAMLLTVPERRRMVRRLTIQGFSPSQVASVLGFQALMLGIASSIVGLALGDQLSRHVFQSVPGYLSFAFPVGGQRIVTFTTIAVAVTAGVGASLLASAPAFRDAFEREPGTLLDAERSPLLSGRIPRFVLPLIGCLCIAATVLVVLVFPQLTIVGMGALVVGMLLLLPSILAVLVDGVWASVSRVSVGAAAGRSALAPAVVATSELRAKTARGTALAATIALAVFGSVAIMGAYGDLLRGLDSAARGLTHSADLWITPASDANTLTTMDFAPPAWMRSLRKVPGVEDVRTYQGGFLDFEDRRVWAIGRPARDRIIIPAGQVLAGDPATAVRRIRAGGWAAVSDVIAERERWKIGQPFELPTPSGPARFRLAARLTNVGWAPGTIILNQRDYRRAWLTADPSAVELDLAPGARAEQVVPRLDRIVGSATPLRVQTAAQRWQLLRDNARQGLNRLKQIAMLVLIGAVLSTAVAMTATVWQRRRALASHQVQGFGFWQLWSSLVGEAAILLGLGSAIGALFGLGGQMLLSRWLRITTGFPADYGPAFLLAAGIFALVAIAALAVIAIPGFIAARSPMRLRFAED
jgi:putative ABC transport system permease protein